MRSEAGFKNKNKHRHQTSKAANVSLKFLEIVGFMAPKEKGGTAVRRRLALGDRWHSSLTTCGD